jgi:hypothetical protein
VFVNLNYLIGNTLFYSSLNPLAQSLHNQSPQGELLLAMRLMEDGNIRAAQRTVGGQAAPLAQMGQWQLVEGEKNVVTATNRVLR